jgi:hypothetical protein
MCHWKGIPVASRWWSFEGVIRLAKSQETRERFMELRARGQSYAKISEALEVSKPTLIKWGRQYSAQIQELQEQEMEAMCERFRIARQHRVERFVQQIDRLEQEFESRDLTEVQTDRLMRLWIRMMEAVRTELEPDRLEVTGRVEADPLARWEEIVRQCLDVEAAAAQLGMLTES